MSDCPHDEVYYGVDPAKPNSEFTAKIQFKQPDFRTRTCGECAWQCDGYKDRQRDYLYCRRVAWGVDKSCEGVTGLTGVVTQDTPACPAFVEAKP